MDIPYDWCSPVTSPCEPTDESLYPVTGHGYYALHEHALNHGHVRSALPWVSVEQYLDATIQEIICLKADIYSELPHSGCRVLNTRIVRR